MRGGPGSREAQGDGADAGPQLRDLRFAGVLVRRVVRCRPRVGRWIVADPRGPRASRGLPEAAQRRVLRSLISASQSMELATPCPQRSWACAGCAYARRCDAWQVTVVVDVRRDPVAA